MMLTFTVDPMLFSTPKEAYRYICERRCIGRTLQDLDRANCLHSRRYFYVVEFQKNTEQAHFHILLDASFIPFDVLLGSWSKHRPATAGLVEGDRPKFGTVLFSKRDFQSPAHAGRYATKYLIKTPEYGYPKWVLEMGSSQRVRRFSTSRGLWNNPTRPKQKSKFTRKVKNRTYAERCAECGHRVNLFVLVERVDTQTGEIFICRKWLGMLVVDSSVLDELQDEGDPRRRRRILHASSVGAALHAIELAAGHQVEWVGFHCENLPQSASVVSEVAL